VHFFFFSYISILKLHTKLYIPNYDIYLAGHHDRHKGGSAIVVEKGIPHRLVDVPTLLSVEHESAYLLGTLTCCLQLFINVRRLWSDTDAKELLGSRNNSVPVGDLNAKHPVWTYKVSNPSGLKLFLLVIALKSQLHNALCSTHLMAEMMFSTLWCIRTHQNIPLSEVIVTDILDSHNLPTMFSMLEALDPVEKLTAWKLFQSLDSELITPNIQIHTSNEAHNEAHIFAASIEQA
jgi:hypothetical protein